MNADKLTAISNANAILKAQGLPSYSELLAALEESWDSRNDPAALGTAMYNVRAVIAKATAA